MGNGNYAQRDNARNAGNARQSRALPRERSASRPSQSVGRERSSVRASGRVNDRVSVRSSSSGAAARPSISLQQNSNRPRASVYASQGAARWSQSALPPQSLSRNRVTIDASLPGYGGAARNAAARDRDAFDSRANSRERAAEPGRRGQMPPEAGRRKTIPKETPGAEIVLDRVSKAEMTSPLFRKLLVVVIIAALVALAVFVVIPYLNNVGNYEKTDPVVTETFSIANADTSGFPGTQALETFSLTAKIPPSLTDEQKTPIENAIKDIESTGAEVGFMFYSTKSGFGICYNGTVNVYGASSIKALYALYVCENFIETGEYSLDSYIRAAKIIDGSDGYEVGAEYNLRALMQDMLIKSSNNAFVILRAEFDDRGWNFWVDSLGCDELERNSTYNFAWYSPRSASIIWTDMYNYLNGEQTETVKAMKEWLGQSYLSFARNATRSKGATAYAKAGWNKDDDPDWCATCDNGIINLNGDTYICSFMTSMPYDDAAKSRIENLILQCFVCYPTLVASQ